MWLIEAIKTEMLLGKIKEKLSCREIEQKCIDNGIQPRLYTSKDGRICHLGITDEEFNQLFEHEDLKNGIY